MNFLKRYWIDPAIIGATAIGVFLIILFHNHKSPRKELEKVQELQIIKADSTNYWRDQYDREHAEKFMAQGELEEIRTVWGKELKDKATELGVKEKQIKSLTMFSTEQAISLDSIIDKYVRVNIDTVRGVNGTPDEYIPRIIYTPGLMIPVHDSLGVTNYIKKSGFLGYKKDNMLDIVSYNQSRVHNIQSFSITDPGPHFRIRPVISAIYIDKTFVPAIGIGVEFKILHIPVLLNVSKGLK